MQNIMQINTDLPSQFLQIIQGLSLMSNHLTIKLPKNEGRRVGKICCARPGMARGLGYIGTEQLCTYVRHQ
jgi:hypothetical protein